ncbi:MAG: glycosyltransferase [Bryobacteraceae bacterium]
MKVLHVINHLDLGGAERLLADVAPLLRERGVDVAVAALNLRDTRIAECLRRDGVPVIAEDRPLRSPAQIAFIRRVIRDYRPDIVHAHLFPAMLWAAMAGNGTIRFVATEHNTWNRRRRWWFRAIDRQMYSGYRQIICVSQQVADALGDWLPELRPRVRVVANGIAIDNFPNVERQENPSPFTVLTVGRITEQKGIDVLMRAVRELPQVVLCVAGEGHLRGELEDLARSLGIEERVRFLGARSDVPQLLAAADVYVQSSRWEGFGLAAVEAMASGLPVVVSDVPGLSDVVGNAGLKFAMGDSAGLARAIRALTDNAGLRKSLSKNARLRAAEFSIERTADQYLTLYREVLGETAPVAWKGEPHAASPTH